MTNEQGSADHRTLVLDDRKDPIMRERQPLRQLRLAERALKDGTYSEHQRIRLRRKRDQLRQLRHALLSIALYPFVLVYRTIVLLLGAINRPVKQSSASLGVARALRSFF